MNKRSTLVTFASAAVLLGLFNINNSLTVKADTVEQPAVGQRNTQAATTNDQNNKSDQNQAQTNQNNDVATDQAQDQTTQNNTGTTTNNTNNQNNTGVADTTNTDQNTQNQVTSDNVSNDFSNTSYVQNNDAVVYNLDPQAIRVLQTADVNPKDLTEVQLKEVRKLNFNELDKDTSTHWSYDQYAGVAKKMIDQDAQYRVPYFNAKKIKNMPATVTRDAQTGQVAELEIWDSWPV